MKFTTELQYYFWKFESKPEPRSNYSFAKFGRGHWTMEVERATQEKLAVLG